MKKLIIALLIIAAVYSRLVGISWGLPYPMHPDERNMAVALQAISCDLFHFQSFIANFKDCSNPHFFAYGQLPLYAGYMLIQMVSIAIHGALQKNISFEAATLSLRLLSIFASWGAVYVMYRIIKDFFKEYFGKYLLYGTIFVFVFSPFAIQFSHFGTTESLLMFLYLVITYFSLAINTSNKISSRSILILGLTTGLAIGVKASSGVFLFLPTCVILWTSFRNSGALHKKSLIFFRSIGLLIIICAVFTIISSPHILLSWKDFVSSMQYESGVASGNIPVFYTRQFLFSIPGMYQLVSIFPPALGMGQYVLCIVGFLLFPLKDKRYNILRIAVLCYFVPSIFLFVKWSRFVAPILPLMSIVAVLTVAHILSLARNKTVGRAMAIILLCIVAIPGIAYVSIYMNNDVRFTASEWIYEHIPSDSHVFSEGGNVINIPIIPPYYKKAITSHDIINFDFYAVDENKELQDALVQAMSQSEYIIVPSRRVFGSVTCADITGQSIMHTKYFPSRCLQLEKVFPVTNEYYDKLLSGELGFTPLRTFSSFPKISFLGKTIIEFPDEEFDETWNVFDHPVIRVYKRI